MDDLEGLGGYTAVAREITRVYGLDPPLDRRNVYEWNYRRTENRDGRPFPSPAREVAAKRTRPRLLFRISDCLRWYSAGVPGKYGRGWR